MGCEEGKGGGRLDISIGGWEWCSRSGYGFEIGKLVNPELRLILRADDVRWLLRVWERTKDRGTCAAGIACGEVDILSPKKHFRGYRSERQLMLAVMNILSTFFSGAFFSNLTSRIMTSELRPKTAATSVPLSQRRNG